MQRKLDRDEVSVPNPTGIHIGDTAMTLNDLREEMLRRRERIDEYASARKDSQSALPLLHDMYRGFSDEERLLAHQVLSEWALSDDENLRFDALAVIDEFKIADTKIALDALSDRLHASDAPSAPYELEKVRRVLRMLH